MELSTLRVNERKGDISGEGLLMGGACSWAGPARDGAGPEAGLGGGHLRTVLSGFLEATSRQQLRTLK